MGLTERLLIGLAAASAIVYGITPYVIVLADRLQFYDKPVGYKGHTRPTPYLGGAAVMTGFVLAMLLAAGEPRKTIPLVGGVTLLWAVGTVDDRRTVSPRVRVLVEVALAAVVWASGLGWDLHLGGLLDLSLTCLWVLCVVNAFNLFDNMDGAASTMALVVSAGVALIGVVRGDVWLTVGAASLGGACLGFLPRNLSLPARIFLGDGGSMPLGFASAVLVMAAAGTSRAAWESLLVALLLVGIPVLDTSLVIVSRRRRGVSILTGGRDHLTHRARRFLPSARAVALSLGALQAMVSVVAVLASQGGGAFVMISAALYLLAAGGAIAILDNQDVEEFGVSSASASLGPHPASSRSTLLCLLVLGLGAGLSPFFFAYYEASTWVPIGLGIVAVCAAAMVARPIRFTGPMTWALGGLLGLGVWSLCSTAWAESIESAVVSGNRWLLYGALLMLMLVVLRSDRRGAVLLGAAGLGVIAVALSVLARLLGSDSGALFLGGRLNSPLGYINGEGCLFVMGLWVCLAAAELRRPLIAGPAAGMATLMACLALLSESRGTAVAMIGSLIAVVAFVPGRRRRVYGLLLLALGLVAAAPRLLYVYHHTVAGSVPPAAAHGAGRAALLAAVAVGVAWALLTGAMEAIRGREALAQRIKTAASWVLVVPVVLALAVGVGSVHRIDREAHDEWHAFTHLADPTATTASAASASYSRLLSGAGNRYDYWRIAWRVWRSHPVLGVGAGNYQRSYYEQRATTEDIQQPHSIELQALSELGLVGLLLLAGFLGGVAWGAARMRAAARGAPLPRALMVASVGAVGAWLAQTSVDWMHLLPGLTAIALAAVAVLIRPRGELLGVTRVSPPTSWRRLVEGRLPRLVGASAVGVTLVVAGASLSRQGLADVYRSRAQHELAAHPAAALTDANRSLSFDSDAVEGYYLKAAALARFDQASSAEAVLRQALVHEPNNFVTWTLLGDIASRELRPQIARQVYSRALELNPRDVTLRSLVLPSAAPPAKLNR